ncbi:hypothetical protein [Flaviaesturariibacter terrae]
MHPEQFIPYFPLLFVVLVPVVFRTLAKRGWDKLAAEYRYDLPFDGRRIGITSAGINGVGYRNCLVLWIGRDGFYLKPVFLFRLFHPPLLIPWRDVRAVREKKVLFTKLTVLTIGSPPVAEIELDAGNFDLLERSAHAVSVHFPRS